LPAEADKAPADAASALPGSDAATKTTGVPADAAAADAAAAAPEEGDAAQAPLPDGEALEDAASAAKRAQSLLDKLKDAAPGGSQSGL
jgi:hypothetical protein